MTIDLWYLLVCSVAGAGAANFARGRQRLLWGAIYGAGVAVIFSLVRGIL